MIENDDELTLYNLSENTNVPTRYNTTSTSNSSSLVFITSLKIHMETLHSQNRYI